MKVGGVICTILIAALIFVLIHGWDIINPQNVAMYKSTGYLGNDRNQHYYGWAAYRNAAWRFPIGLFDSLTYPDSISIIFTDSIPLLAVIFKLFSAFLPVNFQYFGLWGLACYVLVALISYRILYRATGKLVYSVLGSTLFVIAPIMLHRTMVHEALMGQWVVLYAMETLIFIKDYIDTKKIYIRTAVLGLLASTIHMYFLLMCGVVMIGTCLAVWIKEK